MAEGGNKGDQPGLRRRMDQEVRRIASQHEQLGSFCDLAARSIEEGSVANARSWLERLTDALEAHFSLEERMYFPALHGLLPDVGPDLARLLDEHQQFRSELSRVRELLDPGSVAAASRGFEALVTLLSAHEAREMELLERAIQNRSSQ